MRDSDKEKKKKEKCKLTKGGKILCLIRLPAQNYI